MPPHTCLGPDIQGPSFGYTDAELEARPGTEELIRVVDTLVEAVSMGEASQEEDRVGGWHSEEG